MGVDLLKHNQEAYEKIQEAIKEGKKKIAVSHATGTGKSYLIAKLFEDFSNDKKLVLVPSTYISDQIQALFEKYNIQNVNVMRYQKLIKMSDEDIASMDYSIIVLDEYHHDTSKVWGEKVRKLIDTHPESIIFGTSATPIRSDGINTIDELFEGNCASDLPLSESIAKKIVPLPKYVGALYELDDELTRLRKKVEQATNTKEEKQEFYKKIDLMRSQIEKSYGMPIILNKHIKDREGKYLVFCKKKRHLQEIKETVIGWFRTAGCKNINAYEVYSDYENKDAEYKAFCEDTSHNLKLLFCVDMLNEGLHLENISGVLLLRPTRSSIVWHQQIGRAIEANNTNTPVIIDAVNNFSAVGQGMELIREIKDAIAKEKEIDTDFDDGGFVEIDTFFVLEQVVEIQEMFREIEGRLEGSWDLYIKALKQYKEREGDCLVPHKHIEVVDGVKVCLGQWCVNIRREHIRIVNKQELDLLGFIWDIDRDSFINNCREISKYYAENNKYPSGSSLMKNVRKLAYFISREKAYMQNEDYPVWKKKIIQKYLPDFSSESISSKSLNIFLYYAKLYREKYGHMDIKTKDIVEGYNIGTKLQKIKNDYNKEKLSGDIMQQIIDLGIFLGRTREKEFEKNMKLVTLAVKEGIIVNYSNQTYKEKNLYRWIMHTVKTRYQNSKLSINEREYIQKVTGKTLENLYGNNYRPICVKDIIANKNIGCFQSVKKAAREMPKINIVVNDTSIYSRLNGKITTPYKGRFMFYYATDEEVKKYLEENKASQLQ